MRDARRAVTAAVVTAALAAGTAACDPPIPGSAYATGTTTPKPTASPDPLSGLTGDQITSQAIADLENATSVRYAGTLLESGRNVSLNLTLVRGQGCEGSISVYGMGALQFVYDGTSIWVRPNEAFYKNKGVSAAEIPLLSGKWLKGPKKSGLGDLSSTCSIGKMADSMGSNPVGMVKGAITSLDGQRAVTITEAGDSASGAIYVSDTARPELLRLTSLQDDGSPGSAVGSITFSGYGLPAAITPPPASETLNGGEFGPEIGPITV